MKPTCDIIQDLLPLVQDGVASEDSIRLVESHIKDCKMCKGLTGEMIDAPIRNQPQLEDENIIKKMKRSILFSQIAMLIIGGVVGVAFTNSIEMFYNLMIMPLIGGISYFVWKKKSYWTLIAIFSLSVVVQYLIGAFTIQSEPFGIDSILVYSMIYTVLVAVGIVIGMLLKYAFKKEG